MTTAVTQMDQVVHGAAAETKELSSTAAALATHAEELQGLVGRFRLRTDAPSPASVQATTMSTAPAATQRPRTVLAVEK